MDQMDTAWMDGWKDKKNGRKRGTMNKNDTYKNTKQIKTVDVKSQRNISILHGFKMFQAHSVTSLWFVSGPLPCQRQCCGRLSWLHGTDRIEKGKRSGSKVPKYHTFHKCPCSEYLVFDYTFPIFIGESMQTALDSWLLNHVKTSVFHGFHLIKSLIFPSPSPFSPRFPCRGARWKSVHGQYTRGLRETRAAVKAWITSSRGIHQLCLVYTYILIYTYFFYIYKCKYK